MLAEVLLHRGIDVAQVADQANHFGLGIEHLDKAKVHPPATGLVEHVGPVGDGIIEPLEALAAEIEEALLHHSRILRLELWRRAEGGASPVE